MEMVNVGVLSLLPPIIAIVLALVTKEVLSSLFLGILSGGLIYSLASGNGLMGMVETTFELMTQKLGDNTSIVLFLVILGALVVVVNKAGGSRAYGEWAAGHIRSRRGAQLSTAILGSLIFIDDYFNCLTVGTVMRPVTDKHRISREKLAYIIDATAAPICIIAPVSSWAAAIISQLMDTGAADPMGAFVATIPFNLYALLTLLMVVILCSVNLEYGPMREYEAQVQEQGTALYGDDENINTHFKKGRVFDLLLPIAALIVFSVLAMLYTGGYFAGQGRSMGEAFGATDSGLSLVYGGFGGLIVAFLLFVPRGVLSFQVFMGSIVEGIQSMASALAILTLAWTISGVCRDLLGTGEYVGELVRNSSIPMALLPAIIFAVAALLSFSMGTAWGTFGILLPIVAIICQDAAPLLLTIAFAATLAGSVFGDHCSPISDTTILSSTGSKCEHLRHVSSQIPYAATVAACCLVGYLVAGFTAPLGGLLCAGLTLLSSVGMLTLLLVILHRIHLPHRGTHT